MKAGGRLRPGAAPRRARRAPRGALVALAPAVALAACASLLVGGTRAAVADPTPTSTAASCPESNPPNELTLAGGTPQTAKLDSPFSAPLQVALANTNGCPLTTTVAGTVVTLSAPSSGPSGTFSASGSPSLSVGTDATGAASVSGFTANDLPGSYTVTASSDYGSVSFALTNTAAGIAASIAAQVPVSQAAFTGAAYNRPLQALVLDANGNPVEGATVTFALGAGGGSAGASGASATAAASFTDGQSQATATTDAAGIAISPPFSANAVAGKFTATASTAGVTAAASFALDNVAGTPPRIVLLGSAHRSAVVGTGYRDPLSVEVLDADGKPVQGTTVTFALGSTGGAGSTGGGGAAGAGATFAGGSAEATETTGARGRATSPSFTADDSAGAFVASIAVSGVRNPLTVDLDNLAAKPPTIRAVGAARMTATVDEPFGAPLEVKVLDAAGRPVQGATVTFSLGGSAAGGASASGGAAAAGASFLGGSTQASETTSAAGLAVSPSFTANDTPGAFTATAAVSGVVNPLSFMLDNLAARPPSIRPIDGSDASATVGADYRRPLTVRVVTAAGKPVEGVSVTFTLGAGGGSSASASTGSSGAGASFVGGGAEATETTDADGEAVSPTLIANTVAGTFTATASTAGVTRVASFPLRNLAASPSSVTPGAASDEETGAGGRFPVALAVTVKDKDGNLCPGVAVTFRAPAHGPSGRFDLPGGGRGRSVRVRTNADGVAIAPPFTANRTPGGYVVRATVGGSAAAFALVNEPPGAPA